MTQAENTGPAQSQKYDVDAILEMDMATIRTTKSYDELKEMAAALGAAIDTHKRMREEKARQALLLKLRNARINVAGFKLPWSRTVETPTETNDNTDTL